MAAVSALRLPRGIRARGSSFLVDVTIGGKRQTATCHSIEEALATRKQLKEGRAATTVWTLQQALDATIRTTWRGTAGEKTATTNASTALAFFGPDTPLDQLTPQRISDYIEDLELGGAADGTINRKLAALSKLLAVAHDMGGLTHRPKIRRRREGRGRIRYLTPEEEARHVAVAQQWGKQDHAEACVVLVDTGLRTGELWKLEPRDLTFEGQPMLSVWDPKNGEPRSVPLTRRAAKILWQRSRTGKPFPYDNDWMGYTWDRIREHLGLAEDRQYVPHVLRHTCASRLVQRGVAIPVIQAWLGHKTIQITMRYAHLAPSNLLAAVSVLEEEDTEE